MPLKLKTVEIEGTAYAAVSEDGKPLYEDEQGKEVTFDAEYSRSTITRLNHEAQQNREAKDKAEGDLSTLQSRYADIEDPDAAIAALTTVKNLDDKKLVDAGEVDKIKQSAIQATEKKYEPVVAERDTLKSQLHKALIGDNFARSEFVKNQMLIPVDFVESKFSQNFSIEDGQVVATDTHGAKIYSTQRPGELASFDEAMEHIVGQMSNKDQLLKGRDQRGSGSPGGGQTTPSGQGKTMSSEEFSKLGPKERAAAMEKGMTLRAS